MDHLLRNALRHAPERTEIRITSQTLDGFVEVAVADRGPGLTPDQVKQLFVPFTHLQTPEAPGSQGSGLGLSLCRQVIERHHGTIQAESSEGQGTTIRFTLPVATARFLLEEACRSAEEAAEAEQAQYALIVVAPAGTCTQPSATLQEAARVLRHDTHQGDSFVQVDERTLAIVAVTDRPGVQAMVRRLQQVIARTALDVQMVFALAPHEGKNAEQLLAAARRRLT
jgi:light-regulated signal transduction histidine kinase (bacteriophytochrome)